MTKGERQFLNELIAAAKRLFDQGIYAPSAEDILAEYYDDKVFPRSAVDDARKRLNRIRSALAEDGYGTMPLAETYYRTGSLDGDRHEAMLCLASGNGKRAAGIGLLVDEDTDADLALIWQVWEGLNAKRGAAMAKNATDRIVAAVDAGFIDDIAGATTLVPVMAAAQLDNPDRMREMLEAAEDEEEEEE